MWMPLRAWWYSHFVKNEAWPADVREYIFRSGLKLLDKAENIPPEVQAEIAQKELLVALEYPDLMPGVPPSELIADAMSRLGQIPLEHCATCGRPVFTHEAAKLDGKSYCESCASQKTDSRSK